MAQILGVKDIKDLLQARIVVDMDDQLHRLDPNEAPFQFFLNELPKAPTTQPKFDWLEKDVIANWSDITSFGGNWQAGAADDGTITVPLQQYFNVGDVIQAPNDSYTNIIITAKAGATGAGALTAQTVDGTTIDFSAGTTGTDKLKILSSSDESGSAMRGAKHTVAVPKSNYIQVFKTGIEGTEVDEATLLYGGMDRNEQRFEKGIEHIRKLEHAFLFGSKAEQATGLITGAHPQWFTGGVYNMLDSTEIVTDGNGTLTEIEWNAWLLDALRYGSEQKVIFAAEIFGSALTFWAKNHLRITSQKETKFGMRITEYMHPVRGSVRIIIHNRVFDLAPYNGMAICTDLANVRYRFLQTLDTKLYTDIQNKNVTKFEDELRTYAGLQINLSKTHRVLKGVTAYS